MVKEDLEAPITSGVRGSSRRQDWSSQGKRSSRHYVVSLQFGVRTVSRAAVACLSTNGKLRTLTPLAV
jgi:hypothetical protein